MTIRKRVPKLIKQYKSSGLFCQLRHKFREGAAKRGGKIMDKCIRCGAPNPAMNQKTE